MNPFLDLSRDVRLAPNLAGFCAKLRAPQVLHDLAMAAKPDHVGMGDHLLACLLDNAILTLTMRRDYRGVHRLLGTLFGENGNAPDRKVRVVTAGDGGAS